MNILIGSEKGGTGKTTLTCSIAALLSQKSRVGILDADPQESATAWSLRRSDQAVVCVTKTGDVRKAVGELVDRCDHVLVDAGGRDSAELRSAMLVVDLVLIPCRPSQMDLESTLHIDQLVQAAREARADDGPRARVVLSQCPTHHMSRETEQAGEYLRAYSSLDVCRSHIAERKAFRDAMTTGQGVCELGPSRADIEVRRLLKEIL